MKIKIEQLVPLLKKGWIAMGKDGKWYWYSSRPQASWFAGTWVSKGKHKHLLNNVFYIRSQRRNWKNTLIEIKGEEKVKALKESK